MSDDKELPAGWVWTTLGDVCVDSQYGWTTSANAEGEILFLRTTDITSGSINWDSVPYCLEPPADVEKYLLHDGDIVISRAGSVGYSILIKYPRRAVFASYLIRFRPKIDPQYTAYFLQSPSYWKAISEQRLGIAIPNVNASKLRQINFPLAPPAEQRWWLDRIAEHVGVSLGITDEDLMAGEFQGRGGLFKARQVFGDELPVLLDELNGVLVG